MAVLPHEFSRTKEQLPHSPARSVRLIFLQLDDSLEGRSYEQPVLDGLTTIRQADRILIERTVGEERGNIERAATTLRISRSLLYDRILRHRILVSRM